MKKVRIEIDGVLYESTEESEDDDIPCFVCQLAESSPCGMSEFCRKHLGRHSHFVRKSFDEILTENKDVLHRLKMGFVPAASLDDDSEYIND